MAPVRSGSGYMGRSTVVLSDTQGDIMKSAKWIVAALLVLAVAAGGFGLARWLGPKGPATNISVNVESIRKIAQLATVEYRLSTLVERTFRSSYGLGTCDSSKMLAYYTGTVKGSVDLGKIALEVKDAAPAGEAAVPARRKATIRFP